MVERQPLLTIVSYLMLGVGRRGRGAADLTRLRRLDGANRERAQGADPGLARRHK